VKTIACLTRNIQTFRHLAGEKVTIVAGVKANAFGHGLEKAAKIFLENDANWIFVNSLEEAVQVIQLKKSVGRKILTCNPP
jgi:alanine racemase